MRHADDGVDEPPHDRCGRRRRALDPAAGRDDRAFPVGARLVAGRWADRLHRAGRSAPLHRRLRAAPRQRDRRVPAGCSGRREPGGPPYHEDRLALGRGGTSRSLGSPVRDLVGSRSSTETAPPDPRRLRCLRPRLAPGRHADRLRGRPRAGGRPSTALDGLGRHDGATVRSRPRADGDPRRPEVLSDRRPSRRMGAGSPPSAGPTPSRSTTAAPRSSSARPTVRRRRCRSLRPSTDRPASGSTRTSTAG